MRDFFEGFFGGTMGTIVAVCAMFLVPAILTCILLVFIGLLLHNYEMMAVTAILAVLMIWAFKSLMRHAKSLIKRHDD